METVDQRRSELDTQSADLAKRQSALDAKEAATHAHQDAEMRPIEAALTTEMNAPAPVREHVDMPALPDIKSVFNGKDYQDFAYQLLGIALIGAGASKGNWLAVSSTLHGALQGWHDGKQEEAQRMLDQYEREYKAAKDHEAQANKQYSDIMDARNLSINQKLSQIRVLAAQHGRQDVALAAEQKSLDAVARQIESGRNALTQVESRHDMLEMRLAATRALHDAAGGGGWGKGAPQTEGGQELAAETMALGIPVSFFAGKGRLFDLLAARGISAADIASGKVDIAAATAGARQATVRLQGVERLTRSVQELQSLVVGLAQKNGNAQLPAWNATMNTIKKSMGDGTLQQLHTLMSSVGRQYAEAVTMPGSNAQMHATAQDWANGLFNENMSLDQIRGAIAGMNAEIGATHRALEQQRDDAINIKPPGAARAPVLDATAPYTDKEKERRYQEWKKQHAGGQ